IPRVYEEVKKLFGREPHKGVNPDEVVALGAAIQAGVLSGDVKDLLLLDVTPLTLGIETLGGVSTALIERNTTIPTKKSQVFSTAADNQTSVEIHVLQGERPMAKDNRTLGRFTLDGIPSAPRGLPQVEVIFDIDANGILNVSAIDKGTNKKQHITITASSGLSKEEIDKLMKEAQANESEDKKKREEIETRNQTDALVYATEKTVKDNKDKLDPSVVKEIEEALAACKKAVESGDVDQMKKESENLIKASHKMAETLYKSSAQQQPPPPSGEEPSDNQGKKDEKVVDAEFTEEK
ncbi:MAG: Hsp70 family protein, partial [bacterium]|nr:Hsp70 family protein [bacterium]